MFQDSDMRIHLNLPFDFAWWYARNCYNYRNVDVIVLLLLECPYCCCPITMFLCVCCCCFLWLMEDPGLANLSHWEVCTYLHNKVSIIIQAFLLIRPDSYTALLMSFWTSFCMTFLTKPGLWGPRQAAVAVRTEPLAQISCIGPLVSKIKII